MKKFIAAFDGLRFSESTLDYAVFFAKHTNAHLVGVFLEDFTRHTYSVADITKYAGEDFDRHIQELNNKDSEERDESIDKFERACQNMSLNYTVHRDRNVAIQELLHESIYADLIILAGDETLTRYEESSPTRFIRELLSDAQCPVVVVPEGYKPVEKIVLLYDGAPSSVYAVRAFSYLFDALKHFETQVVTVKEREESMHLPDNRLMKEFIKRHYPKAEYVVLKGTAEDEIIRFLHSEKKDPLIALGAYRRSKLSRLFKPSMADQLLHHVKMPLFIAHNKS
ncbi:MAG TPA: universal stress protein [Flavisolibacter sp.]|nr:universal stress protein [Flavisolibacter sp.]